MLTLTTNMRYKLSYYKKLRMKSLKLRLRKTYNSILFHFQDGTTPLMYASSQGSNTFVSILLGAGADIHAKDEEECTALHLAAKHGHEDVCHALIEYGANVSGV